MRIGDDQAGTIVRFGFEECFQRVLVFRAHGYAGDVNVAVAHGRRVRSLGLSHSAAEKLANLLLEWTCKNGESSKAEPRLKLRLTHEEIAQMIGTSRETVTRLFADMKKHQIV